MSSLYFDHNATTPVAPEVAEAMATALSEVYGNASSVHGAGQLARQRLESSRRVIASALHVPASELVFTSGGTESNNLAILGLVRNLPGANKHVITTQVEHAAVLEPCRQLEREGVAVTYVPVDAQGGVSPDAIRSCLRPETVMVSVMHANNESGAIEPIEEIAEMVHRHGAYMHSDGVQALGKIPVKASVVDLYSVSAHKVFAPKGVGGLFVRKGTPVRGIQFGGRHERERRAGTENVPGAIAFARAMELCRDGEGACPAVRDLFERRVFEMLDGVEVNAGGAPRLANTSNLLFRGISGESMVISLDMKGMAVSSGSACSSGSVEPSHVLLAMGRTAEEARSSVRFSFGRYNTLNDAEALAEAVIASVGHLRRSVKREMRLVHG